MPQRTSTKKSHSLPAADTSKTGIVEVAHGEKQKPTESCCCFSSILTPDASAFPGSLRIIRNDRRAWANLQIDRRVISSCVDDKHIPPRCKPPPVPAGCPMPDEVLQRYCALHVVCLGLFIPSQYLDTRLVHTCGTTVSVISMWSISRSVLPGSRIKLHDRHAPCPGFSFKVGPGYSSLTHVFAFSFKPTKHNCIRAVSSILAKGVKIFPAPCVLPTGSRRPTRWSYLSGGRISRGNCWGRRKIVLSMVLYTTSTGYSLSDSSALPDQSATCWG